MVPDSPPPGPAFPAAPTNALELDNDLWRFAYSFYAREGVSPACLTLQDKLDVDVDILLFAIFARVERSILLDADDLAVVDNLVRDWRSEIVQVLRRARTRKRRSQSSSTTATARP